MSPHKRSREAYAREHGLDATIMAITVHYNKLNAEMYRWQADFNKVVKFKLEPLTCFDLCHVRDICPGVCRYCNNPIKRAMQ